MKTTPRSHFPGFTLVELLTTITIIATIAGASAIGYQSVCQKARMVTEINASRDLMAAYLSDAADNNGAVMPGYQTDPNTTDLNGKPLAHPMNARYPWRLAAAGTGVEGTMLFNGNESALRKANSDYLVSVMPNLGINAVLVGGHYGSGSPLPPSPRIVKYYGKFYLDRLVEAVAPERLIVFASARSGENSPGYFEIRSPQLTSRAWSPASFTQDTPASRHGFVDFRYSGKAVVANLAGNVELLTENQLRDMRRWSNQAAAANDENFLIKPIN